MSKVKVYRYPNGAKIIYVEDKDAEFTYFTGEFKVGAVDEEKGKEGAAHFLEHMAFKTTLNMSEYDRKKNIEHNVCKQKCLHWTLFDQVCFFVAK